MSMQPFNLSRVEGLLDEVDTHAGSPRSPRAYSIPYTPLGDTKGAHWKDANLDHLHEKHQTLPKRASNFAEAMDWTDLTLVETQEYEALMQGFVHGRLDFYDDWERDLKYFVDNKHVLLGALRSDVRHPFSRSERYLLLSSMAFVCVALETVKAFLTEDYIAEQLNPVDLSSWAWWRVVLLFLGLQLAAAAVMVTFQQVITNLAICSCVAPGGCVARLCFKQAPESDVEKSVEELEMKVVQWITPKGHKTKIFLPSSHSHTTAVAKNNRMELHAVEVTAIIWMATVCFGTVVLLFLVQVLVWHDIQDHIPILIGCCITTLMTCVMDYVGARVEFALNYTKQREAAKPNKQCPYVNLPTPQFLSSITAPSSSFNAQAAAVVWAVVVFAWLCAGGIMLLIPVMGWHAHFGSWEEEARINSNNFLTLLLV